MRDVVQRAEVSRGYYVLLTETLVAASSFCYWSLASKSAVKHALINRLSVTRRSPCIDRSASIAVDMSDVLIAVFMAC